MSTRTNYNGETIVIPKSKFDQIRKTSGFFEVFINRNFSNSNQMFNSEGNYLLKLEMLPETFYYRDPETNTEYTFKRRKVFDALHDVLFTGHTSDRIVGKFIADYFMFPRNTNFYHPTLPVPKALRRPTGYYAAKPGKKQKQKTRKIVARFNNNAYLLEPTSKELRKAQLMKEIAEERANALVAIGEVLGNERAHSVLARAERANANRTKYGKSKRPSRTSRTTSKHKGNSISRNLMRKHGRTHKRMTGNRN
jgi:hypothetical protein